MSTVREKLDYTHHRSGADEATRALLLKTHLASCKAQRSKTNLEDMRNSTSSVEETVVIDSSVLEELVIRHFALPSHGSATSSRGRIWAYDWTSSNHASVRNDNVNTSKVGVNLVHGARHGSAVGHLF